MKNILLSFITLLFIIGCSSKHKSEEKEDKYSNLVGKKYNFNIYNQIGGKIQTLSETNSKKWIAYFPKANITIIEDKKTSIILKVIKGKNIDK